MLALEREVNNGGYHQFFWNSSRRFTPQIVAALNRIGHGDAAALTDRAIAALGVAELTVDSVSQAIAAEDPVRDAILSSCDADFYKLNGMLPAMFRFIIDHAAHIQLERTDDYPRIPKRTELSVAAKLKIHLNFWKKGWNPSLDEARQAATEIATKEQMVATWGGRFRPRIV